MFNDPLRQYFNLYRTVSQREEKEERKNRPEIKIPSNPHPHLLKAQSALALVLSRLVGRPGTESYPAPSPAPTTSIHEQQYKSGQESVSYNPQFSHADSQEPMHGDYEQQGPDKTVDA